MAAPDMRIAGDDFFDSARLFDLSVVSTLGLDEESLDMVRQVEGVGLKQTLFLWWQGRALW